MPAMRRSPSTMSRKTELLQVGLPLPLQTETPSQNVSQDHVCPRY